MSDMWCRGDFQRAPSRKTQKGKFKTKERRKHLGRSGALCNLASLKICGVRKKCLIKKTNTIRKYDQHEREETNATYPISTFPIVANLHFPSSHIFYHQLGSLCMLFDLFFSLIVCPPPTPFHYFFIANPKLRGEDFNSHIFNHFSRSEYSFQDRCTHQ
jgi:hypothetical protein